MSSARTAPAELCTTTREWALIIWECFATVGTSIPLAIWAMHQYRTKHANARPLLYRLIMAFYVVCILFMLARFGMQIVRCFSFAAYIVAYRIHGYAYILRWAIMLAVYLARLHIVFNGTVFEIGKNNFKILVAIYAFLVVCYAVGEIIRMVDYGYVSALFASMITLILLGCFHIALCVVFIKRLNRIRTEDAKTDRGSDGKVFAVLTKYTILTIFGCAATWMFIIWLCIIMFLPFSRLVMDILDTLVLFDVYSDIVCMTFTFAFAERGYLKLCALCDRTMKTVYGGDENQLQLEAVVMPQIKNVASDTADVSSANGGKNSQETSMSAPSAASTPTDPSSLEP